MKQYFNNIDGKNATSNEKFWKTIRPKFSNKYETANTIILVENETNLPGRKSFCKRFQLLFH